MGSLRANVPRDPGDRFRKQPVETPQAEMPATVELDTSRRSADQIFDEAAELARNELSRPNKALAVSGLAGGLTMGLTGLGVSAVRAMLGDSPSAHFASMIFYPLGFIAVIIGRAQLFTENTLYPVVLVLSERKHLLSTLRLWTIVFLTNVAGASAFALLAIRTSALAPDIQQQLITLGKESALHPITQIFWTGVIGGWIIALVAWMVTASHWTIGQIMVVWLLAFVVGAGKFAHCIATTGEIMAAVAGDALPLSQYIRWIVPATLGNITGGVVIVSLLNWGQVHAGKEG